MLHMCFLSVCVRVRESIAGNCIHDMQVGCMLCLRSLIYREKCISDFQVKAHKYQSPLTATIMKAVHSHITNVTLINSFK